MCTIISFMFVFDVKDCLKPVLARTGLNKVAHFKNIFSCGHVFAHQMYTILGIHKGKSIF